MQFYLFSTGLSEFLVIDFLGVVFWLQIKKYKVYIYIIKEINF